MRSIYFSEAISNIKKSLLTSVLFIVLFLTLFCLFAEAAMNSRLSYIASSDAQKKSLFEYKQISFNYSSSPRILMEAVNSLSEDEIYDAGRAMQNIMDKMYNDYSGYSSSMEYFLYRINDYDRRAIYCSYDLYEICSSIMIISEGSWFEKDDYLDENQLREGWTAPVILGAKLAAEYDLSVGDVFVPDMFYDEGANRVTNERFRHWPQWKVIGILEPESSCFSRGGMIPLDLKALIPYHFIPHLDDVINESGGENTEQTLEFIAGDLFDAFLSTDFYIKNEYMDEAVAYATEQIDSSSFLSQFFTASEASDILMMAAQNQEKASVFYNTVAIITYLVSAFGISMSVVNKIQNNKRNYAVHSLNGASIYDLIMLSVTEISVLMLTADAFFFTIPYAVYYHRVSVGNEIYVGRDTPLFVLAVNILALILTVTVSAFVLHDFDTISHIKKKE